MPRKRTILDVLVTLPWWFNLMLAAALHVFLKFWLPTIEFQTHILRSFSTALPILEWLLPSFLILAAAISAFKAWQRGELLNRQTSIRSIQKLPWKDFEFLVAEAYRRKGYSVQDNAGGGADGGIDLTATKDGKRYLIQCKNWKNKPVGVTTVRELFGVVTAEGAAGGIIVCSGSFTGDAIEFARDLPIELIGNSKLTRLIRNVQRRKKIEPTPHQLSCPTCNSSMIMRTASRGKNAGGQFWGCSRFPKCRGTRQLDA